jgi:3-deoxy-D-manno-octulosonic-acid transferase
VIQRTLYNAAAYLLAPIASGVQLWRGVRNGAADRLSDRFGFPRLAPGAPVIWLHAASVGETQALAPLVKRLLGERPDHHLVITTMTATGAQRVQALFGERVTHVFLPFDLPGAVQRFVRSVAPRLAIVVETEIWPNLFLALKARGVPLLLASARISEKSARRYGWFDELMRSVFASGVTVAAQSMADAERFAALGVPAAQLQVAGNIKFDMTVADDVRATGQRLRREDFAGRRVWVAGSTHAIEEEIILDAFARAREKIPDLLLILAPRHPPRFPEVGALLERRRFVFSNRSEGSVVTAATAVLLLDTLGELMKFYAAADVAFVGGTLVPVGGHNLLEPVAVDVPVISGPHVFSAPEIARKLLEADALIEVNSAETLAQAVIGLCSDEARRRTLVAHGREVLSANRGALDRIMQIVEKELDKSGQRTADSGQ